LELNKHSGPLWEYFHSRVIQAEASPHEVAEAGSLLPAIERLVGVIWLPRVLDIWVVLEFQTHMGPETAELIRVPRLPGILLRGRTLHERGERRKATTTAGTLLYSSV